MKKNKSIKRFLAVMMSFLMAFSSVQGYIKAEDKNRLIIEDTDNSNKEEIEEMDPNFSVETNENETIEDDIDDATESDSTNDNQTATENDAFSGNQTATENDAVNGIDQASSSDTEELILPDMGYEWEDAEGAQINGLMSFRFFYRNVPMPVLETGEDVTSKVEVISGSATIDNKMITNGAEFDVNNQSVFAFKFEWRAKDVTTTFKPGDWLTFSIGNIKGLGYSEQTKPVELYISGIKVGSYHLTYNQNGDLDFHINFSDNISYFQNISGFYKGSAVFDKVEESMVEEIKFLDSATGIIREKPLDKPNIGDQPATPGSGIGWSAILPPSYNHKEKPSLKKDVKWFDRNKHNIEYRVGFFDLITKYEEGNPFAGNIYENVIIEDELDGDQSYQMYDSGAPFFIEVPIFYYGTNNSIGYQGTYNGDVVIQSGIQSFNQPGMAASFIKISSDNFTQITEGNIEAEVKAMAKSWGIIKNGSVEKLIINVGKLGSTDSEAAITMSDINSGWSLKRIYSELLASIKKAKDNISGYENDLYSPQTNLLKRLAEFKLMQVPAEYEESIKQFVNDVNDYIMSDLSSNVPTIDISVDETITNADVYKNLIASLNNYASDTDVYNTNKPIYIQKWQDCIAIYEKTIDYYIPEEMKNSQENVDMPIYGFIIKYKTKVTNLSRDSVSNSVKVSTGLTGYESSIIAKHSIVSGIKGDYVNGDVVLVKADSRYGYKEEELADSVVKGMAGVKFQVFEAGSDTPIKFIDSEYNKDKHYVYLAGNHDNDAKFTDTLTTDSKGVIALSSLPINGNYYFKEVDTVDGYYNNQNQNIPFTVNKNEITYKLAENVSRAITLKKVDADTNQGLEGVTFAIYNQADNTELTGFTKDGSIYFYDGKGKDVLKTSKDGLLEVRNLPAGKFYVKEIAALDGYKELTDNANYFPFELLENMPDKNETIIKINNGDSILNFKENVPENKVSLKVIKKGSDNKILAGVQFELYAAFDDSRIDTYTTNSEGEILIDDLTIGNYYLIEVKGAEGYLFDSSVQYPVVLNGEEQLVEKTIVNEKKTTTIIPDKPDTPKVDIPEEEVPLGPGESIVEIEDEDESLSGGASAFVEIPEEEVPLASGVPNTKDSLYFWLLIILLSTIALGILNVLRKKVSK